MNDTATTKIALSAVVAAPDGFDACLLPDDFLAEIDDKNLELIVVDGAESYSDRSRPGIKHVWAPGRFIYELANIGLLHASNDWILMFEDHGRPMPGFVSAYRDAIRNNPGVDIISGAIDNLTSTSKWSFATFLVGVHLSWPPAGITPYRASIANLVVRKDAVLPSEMETPCGFVLLSSPRLVHFGNYRHNPRAVIDHTQYFTGRSALEYHFRRSIRVAKLRQNVFGTRPLVLRTVRHIAAIVYLSTVRQWIIMWQLRHTDKFQIGILLRMMMIGFASGAGLIWNDFAQFYRQRR